VVKKATSAQKMVVILQKQVGILEGDSPIFQKKFRRAINFRGGMTQGLI
jgi:hypothetical protein